MPACVPRRLAIVVILTAALWAAALSARDATTITGTVVDATTAPIARAKVTLKQVGEESRKQLTDSGGEFKFIVPQGDYQLEVSAPGFETRLFGSAAIPHTIVLQVAVHFDCPDVVAPPSQTFEPTNAPQGEITGEVVKGVGAFKGVTITIKQLTSGHTVLRTATDAEGKFTFANVPPGTYSLTASAPHYADFRVEQIGVLSGKRTVLSPSLPMDACPDGVDCIPSTKVIIPVLCM